MHPWPLAVNLIFLGRLKEHLSNGNFQWEEEEYEDETKLTGVVDSSFERSWCTDQGSLNCFHLPSKFFILLWKSVFWAASPDIVMKVEYFKKLLSDLNKQGLKWKLITTASYFEEKSSNFFTTKLWKFHEKIYFFDVKFCWKFIFPANIYVKF